MKHCEKCGNKMNENTAFCPMCGAKQRYAKDRYSNIEQSRFAKYEGLSIKGTNKNILELLPQGIHIFRLKSLMWERYDKIIPYEKVKGIEYHKANIFTNGYISIITSSAGIAGITGPLSMKDASILLNDQNTIVFQMNKRKEVEEIYNAINELCAPTDISILEDDTSNDLDSKEINHNNNISFIDEMDGHAFEYFCADIMRKNGFSNVEVTPGSGDQGVDILAVKDGIRYAVQCKNYATTLGNTSVQEVNAGKTFYNCHVGVVMTNSTFTNGAIALAEATGVLLWDRDKLQQMMIYRK